MPTTWARRLISRLIRSIGLVDQTFTQCDRGNAVKASTSAFAWSISGPILGKLRVSWSRICQGTHTPTRSHDPAGRHPRTGRPAREPPGKATLLRSTQAQFTRDAEPPPCADAFGSTRTRRRRCFVTLGR